MFYALTFWISESHFPPFLPTSFCYKILKRLYKINGKEDLPVQVASICIRLSFLKPGLRKLNPRLNQGRRVTNDPVRLTFISRIISPFPVFCYLIAHLKLHNKMRWEERGHQDSINEEGNIFELLYLSYHLPQHGCITDAHGVCLGLSHFHLASSLLSHLQTPVNTQIVTHCSGKRSDWNGCGTWVMGTVRSLSDGAHQTYHQSKEEFKPLTCWATAARMLPEGL